MGRARRGAARGSSVTATTSPAALARFWRWALLGVAGGREDASHTWSGMWSRSLCPRRTRLLLAPSSSTNSTLISLTSGRARRPLTTSWRTPPLCCAWSASGWRQEWAPAAAALGAALIADCSDRVLERTRYWEVAKGRVRPARPQRPAKPCPLSFTYQAVRNVAAALALARPDQQPVFGRLKPRHQPLFRRLR